MYTIEYADRDGTTGEYIYQTYEQAQTDFEMFEQEFECVSALWTDEEGNKIKSFF